VHIFRREAKEKAMDLRTARINATDKLKDVCRVCKQCNGVACAGQVPGFGGVGTGSSFINNVKALARLKINLKVLHDVREPDIRTKIFGLNLSMPILGAAVAGARINKMQGIEEHELANAMIGGSYMAGTIGMGGDGGHLEMFEATLNATKQLNGYAIPVIKPRLNDDLIARVVRARENCAVAVAIDVDAAGLVNMALLGQKVEPKTLLQICEIVQIAGIPLMTRQSPWMPGLTEL
jgi:4-hydroxymandelate oxidase